MADKEVDFIFSSSSSVSGFLTSGSSNFSGNPLKQQMVIAVNRLPLIEFTRRDKGFRLDENDSVYQLMKVIPSNYKVTLIGILDVVVSKDERNDIAQLLLDQFGYIPIFLPCENKLTRKLWQLLHGIYPSSLDDTFSMEDWKSYIGVNSAYADKIGELITSENCFFWVEGYHLMLLPNIIRGMNSRSRILFKLDTAFPTLEIFQTMVFKEELIRGMLGADLIAFRASVYCYNFLLICDKLLGLQYVSCMGNLELPCNGRKIAVRVVPVMISFDTLGQLKQLARKENDIGKVELRGKDSKGKGKIVLKSVIGTNKVILSIDHLSCLSEIQLKFLAVEKLLEQSISAVFIQIIIVPEKPSRIEQELINDIEAMKQQINLSSAGVESKHIVTIYYFQEIMPQEKMAYYKCADCVLINAVRDVMYLWPFEFTLFGKGCDIVISENITCTFGLSGVARVNTWSINEINHALYSVLKNPKSKSSDDHKKNIQYVKKQDMKYIVYQLMDDVYEQCKEHDSKMGHVSGVGLKSGIVLLSEAEGKADVALLAGAFTSSKNRLLLIDIDGIGSLTVDFCISLAGILNILAEENNQVFVFSKSSELPKWMKFSSMVGLVTEDGFLRRSFKQELKRLEGFENLSWYMKVGFILETFTKRTSYGYVEKKECAFVWHLEQMEPHLVSSLINDLQYEIHKETDGEAVIVVERDKDMLEVKPQGMNKMTAAERVIKDMVANTLAPDFVLVIGFEAFNEDWVASTQAAVHKIRVGVIPDRLGHYVKDGEELINQVLLPLCSL